MDGDVISWDSAHKRRKRIQWIKNPSLLNFICFWVIHVEIFCQELYIKVGVWKKEKEREKRWKNCWNKYVEPCMEATWVDEIRDITAFRDSFPGLMAIYFSETQKIVHSFTNVY